MTVAYKLRRAEPSDVEGIELAYLTSWRAGYTGLLPEETLNREAALRRGHGWLGAIETPSSVVIVAADDQEIVGVVQAEEDLPEVSDLPAVTMLYVVPSWWGTGVARELLHAATSWLTQRGHVAVRLRVVEEQRRARRFYEREGWRPDDDVQPASNGFFRLVYYRRPLKP